MTWRHFPRGTVSLGGLALLLAASLANAQAPVLPVPARQFEVYDFLKMRNKPPIDSLGMTPIDGSAMFFAPGWNRDSVDEQTARKVMSAEKNSRHLFWIDIENWPVCFVSDSIADRSIAKFERVIKIARDEAPDVRLGLYGVLPAESYWTVVSHDTAKTKRWNACNVRLRHLARQVDAIFPSLYTFYNDPEGWATYASAMLTAARQYGKPVYPFLWPEYHDSNRLLRGTLVPPDYWRQELELCRREADGIVLWSDLNRKWDPDAPWWAVTRSFLSQLRAQRGRELPANR